MIPLAPTRNVPANYKPWEGSCRVKPWQFEVAAAIPVLDCLEPLRLVVELLRRQTVRPFVMLIDTGSTPDNYAALESWRAEDLEVHAIRLNGTPHPSDFPAIAMDLAFSACRSPYLFCTHGDCFVRRQDFLADLLARCKAGNPVVGYEMTERPHTGRDDWKGMVGHTATMLDMATMDRIGAGWSMRRLCNKLGLSVPCFANQYGTGWPDTEYLLNYLLRENGIEPLLIGSERNFMRTLDDNIDHCRTLTASYLYSPPYYQQAKRWAEDAMRQARERLASWPAT